MNLDSITERQRERLTAIAKRTLSQNENEAEVAESKFFSLATLYGLGDVTPGEVINEMDTTSRRFSRAAKPEDDENESYWRINLSGYIGQAFDVLVKPNRPKTAVFFEGERADEAKELFDNLVETVERVKIPEEITSRTRRGTGNRLVASHDYDSYEVNTYSFRLGVSEAVGERLMDAETIGNDEGQQGEEDEVTPTEAEPTVDSDKQLVTTKAPDTEGTSDSEPSDAAQGEAGEGNAREADAQQQGDEEKQTVEYPEIDEKSMRKGIRRGAEIPMSGVFG